MKPTYTKELLKQFDILTLAASSDDQMERINARFDLAKFENEHGETICEEMMIELRKLDEKGDAA